MKKPLLSLLLSLALTGTVCAQALPKKKPAAKPATTETKATDAKLTADGKPAADAAVEPSTAPALPKDFDPKIATDARSSDGKPRDKPSTPAGDKFAKNAKASNDAYEIGKTQLESGNEKEAMVYFDKAIKLQPNNMQALLLRGRAKVMRKMYPEAMGDLNKAVKGLPTEPEAYFWRGRAKQEQDKDKEAVADFNKVLELKPDYADAYYWRGHSFSEMDMLKENACPDFKLASEKGSELGTKALKKYCK